MKKVKNTFAPRINNKELSGKQLIKAMQFGFVQYEDLPQEARDLVNSIKPDEYTV